MSHGAAAESRGSAPIPSPAAAKKVLNFLKQMQVLNAFSYTDLESVLYQCRFELLPPLKNGREDPESRKLPVYNDIPTQQELHDMLLGSHVPGGHQCVAHVLYPDCVPWPSQTDTGRATPTRCSPASGKASPEPVMEHKDSKPQTPKPSSRGGIGTRPGPRLSDVTMAPRRTISSPKAAASLQRSEVEIEAERRKDEILLLGRNDSVPEETRAEVFLCGQKINTTVRGRTVMEASEDFFSMSQPKDDEKYIAAKERRTRLERQLQLERYQERKLTERIHTLEGMKVSEEKHQEALQNKEAKRLARREELRKQLDEGLGRRDEDEKSYAEKEAQRKEQEALADQRWKKYHEKQKEALTQWYADQSDASSAFGEDRARQRREELAAQAAAAREEKERSRLRTVKVAEAEDRLARMQEGIEERPPLPPKPHDRPAPAFDFDNAAGKSQKQAAKAKPVSWVTQAKAVSNMYGLTEKEQAELEGNFLRGIRGAGRMANY